MIVVQFESSLMLQWCYTSCVVPGLQAPCIARGCALIETARFGFSICRSRIMKTFQSGNFTCWNITWPTCNHWGPGMAARSQKSTTSAGKRSSVAVFLTIEIDVSLTKVKWICLQTSDRTPRILAPNNQSQSRNRPNRVMEQIIQRAKEMAG